MDASQSGLGAVLLQEGRPVAFMSKALTDTQSRYSNIECEILGVVTGVEHFHQYLFGKQFTLYTDHKPIENLVLKPLVDTSPRVQRLMIQLSQYHMEVQYKAGQHLLLSDCLSQLSNPASQEEDESLNLHVTSIESEDGDSLPFLTLSNICNALMEDPRSVLLGDLILNGWPESCKDLDQELKPYWIHHFNLSIVDGIILLGKDHIVVPVALHEQFLKALHYTHQGITKTLARARNHAYWPGIAHDVLKLCHECEICAEDHAYPSLSNMNHADAHGPAFKYGADIGEIEGHPHLIVVDYYSFTVFECPLPSLTTTSVITAFKTIFSDTGIPMTLVTDNALCFTSEEFENFAKSWNFTHITSSPRYPKGNTHAEKAVGIVKQIYNRCEDPLYGMLILKTVPLLDVKESPDKIFFGQSLHTNLPKPSMVHTEYKDRYINQDQNTQGNIPNTCNFVVNDPVWIKLNEGLPWKKGVIAKVHDHKSYMVQVDGRMY